MRSLQTTHNDSLNIEHKMRGGYQIRRRDGLYFITFTVVKWIDVFSRQKYKDILIESLKYCQQHKDLEVYAYVIMSNHMHLIVSSPAENLSDIIRDYKKYTSRKILEAINNGAESRRGWMLNIFEFEAKRNKRNTNYQFWIQDNRPIELESNRFMDQKLQYIHLNPVKAGIVYKPEDYVYSSASNYAGLDFILTVKFIG